MVKIPLLAACLLAGAFIHFQATAAHAEKRPKEEVYAECVVETKAVANANVASGVVDIQKAQPTSAEGRLFEAYLRTVKYDSYGCFAEKDPKADKRVNMTLKQYVIGGMDPTFTEAIDKLFSVLQAEGFRPGITSAFRDNYRQSIAVGYAASSCNSRHGGTCRTGGYGHGVAVDVVNVSDLTATEDERWAATKKMWLHIDKIGSKFGIRRPMKSDDPMHLESNGSLKNRAVTEEQRGKELSDHSAKPQKHVKKLRKGKKEVFVKKKKKFLKKKRKKRDNDD